MADEISVSSDEENNIYDLIIIGGGPGGMSAAIYAARAKMNTLVIDKNPMAGALGKAKWIENYPGVPEPIQGQELLKIMKTQAEGFGAKVEAGQVAGVNFKNKIKEIYTNENTYKARTIIIATGSMGRKASIPGEAKHVGSGISYCATCDAPFFKNKVVAMVGDVGLLIKELHEVERFVSRIYVVARNNEIQPEHMAQMEDNPKIKIFPGSQLLEIKGKGRVEEIEVKDSDEKQHTLSVDGVFLYLTGAKPISGFLQGALEQYDQGCIKTDPEDMSTSVPGVFAIGDVTCKQIRQVVVATAEGCIAALSADKYLHERIRMRSQWGGD